MTSPAHIVVTGSSGALGRLIIAALLARDTTRGVLGIDVHPPAQSDPRFRFHAADITGGLEELDAAPGAAWLHLAYPLDPHHPAASTLAIATAGTAAVLRAAERARVSKLVMFSSTMAYGTAPQPLTEARPLAPDPAMGYAEGKRRLEALATGWPFARAPELVILRPCTVLGRGVGRHPMLRAFGDSVIGDRDPRLQVLHPSDLVDGVLRVLAPGVTGTFNLTPSDAGVHTSELRRLLGFEPGTARYADVRREAMLAWQQQRAGALHPATLDYLAFEWVAVSDKARATFGWAPAWSSLDAFWDHLRAQRTRRAGVSA
jgi:nucleoside-diphosphate-sugar epimerase